MILALLLAFALADDQRPATIDSEDAAEALCHQFASYEIKQRYDAKADPVELAEKFANGKGVKRDLGAAIKMVCAAEEIAPIERFGMLDHLQQMRRGDTTEPLNYCDHVSGGHGSYVCAVRHRNESEPQVRARFAAVRKGAGTAATALDALRARADAFIEANAVSLADVNRGGTIHPSVLVYNHTDGEETFVANLERYAKSRASAATAAQAQRADADLNAAYRARMAAAEEIDAGHLRAAQRAWIAYRDAWTGYYAERWRGAAPAETLRREILTQLTRDRTKELAEE